MSKTNSLFDQIQSLYATFEEEHAKNAGGNKAAGSRARKALGEIGRQETTRHIKKVATFIIWFYDYIEGKTNTPPPVGAYKDIVN